jgi:glucan 1,3-beta-glucosidase
LHAHRQRKIESLVVLPAPQHRSPTMRALAAAAAAAALATAATAAPPRRFASVPPSGGFGVNLGGWLVLESWITPSLYANNSVAAGQGEGQFCAAVGGAAACNATLGAPGGHWDSWLGESDIATLAAAGVTHVRIPLG